MRDYCNKCNGSGLQKDTKFPWWKYWKNIPCAACGGSGYAYPKYENPMDRPKPPPEPDKAYALRNSQGYWIGIWNDRKIAEAVRSKTNTKEEILMVQVIPEGRL